MKKKDKKVEKINFFKRFLRFLKKEWNSLMYWLMFKNYVCIQCFGKAKDCDCK